MIRLAAHASLDAPSGPRLAHLLGVLDDGGSGGGAQAAAESRTRFPFHSACSHKQRLAKSERGGYEDDNCLDLTRAGGEHWLRAGTEKR